MFIFPFLAAVLQATSATLDKVILSKKVNFRGYLGISFPISFFVTLIIFSIYKPTISYEFFSGFQLFWLLVSIILTILTNYIIYKALAQDYLGEIETIGLVAAIPTIILSSIVFTSERNFFVVILAIIASAAIIWSHLEGGKLSIRKNTLPFLVCALTLMPLNAIVMKILLSHWSPISLELIRNGVVAAVFLPMFQKSIKATNFTAMLFLLLTNVLTSVAWILFFFSYQKIGIIYTILLFSLQPILVYFAAIFILKEQPQYKKIVAFIIVIASIAIAQFYTRA